MFFEYFCLCVHNLTLKIIAFIMSWSLLTFNLSKKFFNCSLICSSRFVVLFEILHKFDFSYILLGFLFLFQTYYGMYFLPFLFSLFSSSSYKLLHQSQAIFCNLSLFSSQYYLPFDKYFSLLF